MKAVRFELVRGDFDSVNTIIDCTSLFFDLNLQGTVTRTGGPCSCSYPPLPPRGRTPKHLLPHAIRIDRRAALEREMQRQQERQEEMELESTTCSIDCLRDVHDVTHLEFCLQQSPEDQIVVLDLYNTACGVCQEIEERLAVKCRSQDDDVLFLKHNIRDERDDLSDIARLYEVRHAPAFLVFRNRTKVWEMRGRSIVRLQRVIDSLKPGDNKLN